MCPFYHGPPHAPPHPPPPPPHTHKHLIRKTGSATAPHPLLPPRIFRRIPPIECDKSGKLLGLSFCRIQTARGNEKLADLIYQYKVCVCSDSGPIELCLAPASAPRLV